MDIVRVVGILFGGWEDEICLVKGWGKFEVELVRV